jgi:phage terminase large subunit-like protein
MKDQMLSTDEIVVKLPTLHPDQMKALDLFTESPFVALRCGRRWGKTDMAVVVGGDGAVRGEPVGYFAPDYKILSETYERLITTLQPVISSSSKNHGIIKTISGGIIEFWSLDNDRAGRSRKYKRVLIDEAAFTKPNMWQVWETAIQPTLFDLGGVALVMSTPNGLNRENFFWKICNEPQHGFKVHHAPTQRNPHIPNRRPGETNTDFNIRRAQAFARLKQDRPPLVYQQEYLAEFVDWSGNLFFEIKHLLQADGSPWPYLPQVDIVYAVIDTALKTGNDRDGTAVTYFAKQNYVATGPRLFVLDWDIIQIDGALLETWLPTVEQHLNHLARQVRSRYGVAGIHIEDKNSGTILIQQAARRDINAYAIDSVLTSVGKDERAISVSGYVYRGEVGITDVAYNKTRRYKEIEENHFLTQVFGFKIGLDNKNDDLLDTFTYGISIGLGDSDGN